MSFLNALVTVLEVIKKYMFIPGVVDNWNVLIDCTDVTIPDLLIVIFDFCQSANSLIGSQTRH